MKTIGKILIFLFSNLVMFYSCQDDSSSANKTDSAHYPDTLFLNKTVLADKIQGGWAGQLIGCTYGGPTEFRFKGGIIHDYTPIHWDSTLMEYWFDNAPGLYDDIYMDLTFVDVMEKHGINAPARLHAEAFANARYPLWHANQAARYNILNGVMPPASGHWKNNPHADDIDFQIEADFAGLMSPGMVNTASQICDTVGHIMNYGDGWYGGVYVAAMYSLAFVFDDISLVVKEALKAIPQESDFYRTIHDVITWHKKFPDDWKRTWFEVEKKWGEDHGCPDGVFNDFNIDAKLNAAYIVIGLLYGDGDFGKSTEISTRCGQDSDCNPASAAGILGTMMGYSNIPDYWKQGIDKVADRNFVFTTMSLNDVNEIGLNHALQVAEMEGGQILENEVHIPVQKPLPVKLEVGFENMVPSEFIGTRGKGLARGNLTNKNPELSFDFEGSGIVVNGYSNRTIKDLPDIIQMLEVYIDGKFSELVSMPTDFTTRKHDIYWNYDLPEGKHQLKLVLKDPVPGYKIDVNRAIVYRGSRESEDGRPE